MNCLQFKPESSDKVFDAGTTHGIYKLYYCESDNQWKMHYYSTKEGSIVKSYSTLIECTEETQKHHEEKTKGTNK